MSEGPPSSTAPRGLAEASSAYASKQLLPLSSAVLSPLTGDVPKGITQQTSSTEISEYFSLEPQPMTCSRPPNSLS